MRHSHAEQSAVLQAIDRFYREIRGIEEAHHMVVGHGDVRPRIEYFHDAIRAYTSGDTARLTVERLAHDLAFLRHIGEVPLAPLRGKELSTSTAIAPKGQLAPARGRPDRELRQRLGEQYRHYAVMFAALLKDTVDRDYRARVDEIHGEIRDLSVLQQAVEQFARGKLSLSELKAWASQLENDELYQLMQAALAKLDAKATLSPELAAKLKQRIAERDKREAGIEKAHFDFLAAQLSAYEEAKDVVKKLAMQGLNLAGKFLESAAKEAAQRGQRGR